MFSSMVLIFQADPAVRGGAGARSRPAQAAARLPSTGPVPASPARMRHGR